MSDGAARNDDAMRAIVISQPGGPEVLTISERPLPQPGRGQLRIRIHTSALNRADILQRRGQYPAPPGAPVDIPGLEYAGEVDAIGDAVEGWTLGERVMGIVGGGAHAEFVCVHEREAIRIPAPCDWEEAAAIPEAFLTAYDALVPQLGSRMGEYILIHAVGSGVGTAALQLARALGATTLGTSRSPDKLAAALDLGLHHAIDSSSGEWIPEIGKRTRGQGVDAILDLLGGDFLQGNLEVLAPGGRMMLIGTLAGSRADFDLGLALRKRLQLRGTILRTRALEEKIALAQDFSRHVLPLLESGRVRTVIDRVYEFSEISRAHEHMEQNRSFGKIVLRW